MSEVPISLPRRRQFLARHAGLSRNLAILTSSPVTMVALAVFLIIVLLAFLAPLIAPQNPYDITQIDFMQGLEPPGTVGSDGMTYWLGTDSAGRDMLSAILYGLRISLLVGFGSGLVAIAIGATVGILATYIGGRFESFVMRVVDLQLSFPSLLVALMLLAIFGQGLDKVILALILVQWAGTARTIRSAALVEMGKEYFEAARSLGLSHLRIMFVHLLPNCLTPVIVVGAMQVAGAISLEATLSFLGLGLPRSEPSLGLLIANGYKYVLSGEFWISTFPGLALLAIVVSLNLVGDHLRDSLNVRLHQ